jgi:hypothetical protein
LRTPALALCLCAAAGAAGFWGFWAFRAFRDARQSAPAPAAPAPESLPPLARGERRVAGEPLHGTPQGQPSPLAPQELAGAASGVEGRWIEANREAIAALEAGQIETAIAGFEACLAALPDEPALRANLAEALVRQALRDHAARYPCAHCPDLLARARELAPERAEIAELARRWLAEAEAEQGFWRESSLHFDLSYDGSRDDVLWGAPRLLELLEEAYIDYSELFGHYPAEGGAPRIAVALYPRAAFDRLTGLGDWAGGAFDGVVRVPIGDFELDEAVLRRVLRHELVHAFVHAAGGSSVPGWLNEGLAQWLEDERQRLLSASRQALAGAELFPLERLQGSLASWSDAGEIARAYAQSLLLVDHIAREYGERVLFELVLGCRKGEVPAATFERLAGIELETALADLAAELDG